ncbi:hypothetical protein HDU85_004833 [Gaertneriomyces sp. JEL0708]|nr:hypothetical protein HDU85_004833 [Gaertneriomyces sp. JEL0708]
MSDSFFDLTPGKFRPAPIKSSGSTSITPSGTGRSRTQTLTSGTHLTNSGGSLTGGGKSQRVATPTRRLTGRPFASRGSLSLSANISRPKRGGEGGNDNDGDDEDDGDLVIVTPSKSGGDRGGGAKGSGRVCSEVVDVDALFEDDLAMGCEVAGIRDAGMVGSVEPETEIEIGTEREMDTERESEEGVRCPLCAVVFPTLEIEGHAATCNGPSSLVDMSPPPPPTALQPGNPTSTTTATTNNIVETVSHTDAKAKRKQTMAQLLQHRKRREKKRRRSLKVGGDENKGSISGSNSGSSGGESLSETEDATAWVDPDTLKGSSSSSAVEYLDAPTTPQPQPQPLTHGRTTDIRKLIQQPPQQQPTEACCPICARMFPVSEIQQHVDEELSGSMAFDSDIEQELSGDVPLSDHEGPWDLEDGESGAGGEVTSTILESGVFPDDDWFEVNDGPPSPPSRPEVLEIPANRKPPLPTHKPATPGRSDTANVLTDGHHLIPETDDDDDLMMMLTTDSPPSPEYLFSNNPKPSTHNPNPNPKPKPTSAEEVAAQLFPEDVDTSAAFGDEPYSVPDPWPIFSQDDVFDYTNNNNHTTAAGEKTLSCNGNNSDADDQQMSPLQGFDNLNDHKGDPDYDMYWKQFGAGGDTPIRATYQNLDDGNDDEDNSGYRGWKGPTRKTKSSSSSSRGGGTGTRRTWKPRGRGRGRGKSYAGRSMGFKR